MGKVKNEYACSLQLTNDLVGGKWKMRVLWHIIQGNNRFSLLQKGIPDISHKMLITQLKELEETGILIRTAFEEIPPRVEYEIAEEYRALIPLLECLCDFTKQYAERNQITILD